MNAIIGHTGFIGGVLNKYITNCDTYNSKNISDIVGKTYEIVYCSGIQSKKWWANQNPKDDWASIIKLIDLIKTISCEKFILVSTIAVYDDEPYGVNRLRSEEMLKQIMGDRLQIIRLPSVFGNGLRKNVLYDLINKQQRIPLNLSDNIQWYNVDNIHKDIEYMVTKNVELLEVYPKPIKNNTLIGLFNDKSHIDVYDDKKNYINQDRVPINGYYSTESNVISDLKKFINGSM